MQKWSRNVISEKYLASFVCRCHLAWYFVILCNEICAFYKRLKCPNTGHCIFLWAYEANKHWQTNKYSSHCFIQHIYIIRRTIQETHQIYPTIYEMIIGWFSKLEQCLSKQLLEEPQHCALLSNTWFCSLTGLKSLNYLNRGNIQNIQKH